MGFIFLIIVLGFVGWAVGKAASNGSEWRCPFGYDSFGCQPHCPLYEHCWGKRED